MLLWSQLFHCFLPDFSFRYLWLLGIWEQHESKLIPVAGLSYLLTPPTFDTLFTQCSHALIYTICMLGICIFISRQSIQDEDCEENPEKIIQDLLGPTYLTFAGPHEGNPDEALRKEVERLIPVASIFGGLTLGMICVVSDILGIIGGSQGMLVSMSIVSSINESWIKERKMMIEE